MCVYVYVYIYIYVYIHMSPSNEHRRDPHDFLQILSLITSQNILSHLTLLRRIQSLSFVCGLRRAQPKPRKAKPGEVARRTSHHQNPPNADKLQQDITIVQDTRINNQSMHGHASSHDKRLCQLGIAMKPVGLPASDYIHDSHCLAFQ